MNQPTDDQAIMTDISSDNREIMSVTGASFYFTFTMNRRGLKTYVKLGGREGEIIGNFTFVILSFLLKIIIL